MTMGGVSPLTLLWERYFDKEEEEEDYLLDEMDGHWFGDDGGDDDDGDDNEPIKQRVEDITQEINVWHADQVWKVLRLMGEAAYHTQLNDTHHNGNQTKHSSCFQTQIVHVSVTDTTTVEITQSVVVEERRLCFQPLVAFAGLKETTVEMMIFVIQRCHHELLTSALSDEGANNDGQSTTITTKDENDDQQNLTTQGASEKTHNNPESLHDSTDRDGNTPLSIAASLNRNTNPDARCTNNQLFSILLTLDPTAARKCNNKGEYPISRAIGVGIGWDDGVQILWRAFPEVLVVMEDLSQYPRRLVPFMLAASAAVVCDDVEEQDGGEDGRKDLLMLDLCYRLLCVNPEGVRGGILKYSAP